ncbi:putative efflux protein MATE family [Clostridium sp. CAG:505]|nr:putative efflux protein MATE family [Clostridium sp. CAG:505]
MAGVLLAAVIIIGGPACARLFGASDAVLDLSVTYMRILALGLPFQMANMAFTAIIRSDGNPKYTMRSMMIGAGINLVLDPIFIFGFDMGVTGAAIATIIGQVVAGLICVAYIPRFEHITFYKKYLKLSGKTCGSILSLGFPSFCMQMATALTQIVMNNLMTDCGAVTKYGSEIALSCYGIMMKIYQVAHAMFVGVASGTQPINGYNFGAKQYGRVKQTFRVAVTVSFIISIVWFGIFQLGGGFMAGLFVKNEPLYLEFAVFCFRLYMLGFFVYGLPQVTASFFQAIGKPAKSLLVALSRQIIFLIPLALILSGRFGLTGALAAAPIADVLACLLAAVLIWTEFRFWKKNSMA